MPDTAMISVTTLGKIINTLNEIRVSDDMDCRRKIAVMDELKKMLTPENGGVVDEA